MSIKWVTNTDKSRAVELRKAKELQTGKTYLIGRPNATNVYSVEELESMNYVGVYVETSDEKLEPNPNCPECKGKGVIILLTTSIPCKCLKKPNDDYEVYNKNEGYWE